MSREVHEAEAMAALIQAMGEKLLENKHKSMWRLESITWLMSRLRAEVAKLSDALEDYDLDSSNSPYDVIREVADVANFAAMIIDNLHVDHGLLRTSAEQRWAERIKLVEERAERAMRILGGYYD